MKKTITSIVILMAVLISAFAVFTIPASADNAQILTTGSSISLDDQQHYYEAIINPTSVGTVYEFPLTFSQSGNRIIQTFGATSAAKAAKLSIIDPDTQNVLVSSEDCVGNGYDGKNSFLQFNFSTQIYTLRVEVTYRRLIRLSITAAEFFFDEQTPISQFDDITQGTTMTGDFYYTTPAMVMRFAVNSSGDKNIYTEGSDTMKVYVMDASSNTAYSSEIFTGEVDTSIYLYANREYYIVMLLPPSDLSDDPGQELEYVTLTVSIQ